MPLLDSAPPSPEDILAAQLAELGEGMADSSSKKGRSKKKGSGAQRASVEGTLAEINGNDVSVPQGSEAGGQIKDQNEGVGGGGTGGEDGPMYCSACGREYPGKVVEESVARAKITW